MLPAGAALCGVCVQVTFRGIQASSTSMVPACAWSCPGGWVLVPETSLLHIFCLISQLLHTQTEKPFTPVNVPSPAYTMEPHISCWGMLPTPHTNSLGCSLYGQAASSPTQTCPLLFCLPSWLTPASRQKETPSGFSQ